MKVDLVMASFGGAGSEAAGSIAVEWPMFERELKFES